ncbi:AAA family ATPase [Micromonospora avicenniae]|uniref:RecA-family ATPase n=1 Tax=Micromonospora avicenniae TaxID=1198245 RepID=A0A1N6YEP7_9ACTN|nr:AAA family ATPase [Micromonospora avicenniae]SIR13023.1 RecA-family ATPase [Micromonospora avicenniae]
MSLTTETSRPTADTEVGAHWTEYVFTFAGCQGCSDPENCPDCHHCEGPVCWCQQPLCWLDDTTPGERVWLGCWVPGFEDMDEGEQRVELDKLRAESWYPKTAGRLANHPDLWPGPGGFDGPSWWAPVPEAPTMPPGATGTPWEAPAGMSMGVPLPEAPASPREGAAYLALKAALFSEDEFDQRPPVDWLVDKVLPRGSLAYIIGEPGNGKTFVALDLAYSLATGREWWGHEIAETGPVLYVAAEDDQGVQARARAWRSRFSGGQVTGRVRFLAHAPQVGEPGSFEALGEIVAELGPKLVILDTQARVTRGLDENDSKAMGELIHQANQIQKLGATVVMVHHPARGGTVPRGSSSQEGAADVVMFCQMDDDKIIKVKCTKQKNAAEFEPLSLGLDPEGESAVLKAAKPIRWEGQEQIIAWLDELGVPHEAGSPTARKALAEAGREVTKKAVEDAVKLRKSRPPVPRLAAPER